MDKEIIAADIMEEFAGSTGLLPGVAAPVRRYLWTDAFAVCNFLTLYNMRGREEYLHLALNLVDQVHDVLGRHRQEDPRNGWISGLDEGEGRLRPTAGGLRIGKKMPERRPGEPIDEHLEWERDGQYFHYLTKWMHGLCRVGRTLDNPVYGAWAAELAGRAHDAFCYGAGDGRRRMHWKMSIDLSRPQVAVMGHHDPLDGLITYLEIRHQAKDRPETASHALEEQINDFAAMCRGVNWTTPDPLGLGGLLADGWRLAQLRHAKAEIPLPDLLPQMLEAAVVGLSIYTRDNSQHLPATHRLAFRELGLAIGLQAVKRLRALAGRNPYFFTDNSRLIPILDELHHYLPLMEQIEEFWLAPEHREVSSWTDHMDINMVMLATSLAPAGYLDL